MSDAQHQASAMAALLLDLEAALRSSALWQQQPPSEQALASTQPFCVDSLDFSQWLQFVFIPRIRFMLEQHAPLPAVSGIAAMGEEAFRGQSRVQLSLMPVLENIDQCLGQANTQVPQ